MAKAKTIGRRSREIVSKENAEARAYKNAQRFMDVEAASLFLGISVATLRVWSSNRNGQKPRIPLIKIGRNLIRFDRESLTEWLKLQESWPEETRESLT
jgi:predicted DNA-binding transcriptional regulator AlpA